MSTQISQYILGPSEQELRRLVLQGRVLRATTLRLLHNAGIIEGMRVLDVGSSIRGSPRASSA